jgi:hypothetical protein
MKDVLKQHRYGVGVQIPKEWRDARKELSTVYQSEKKKGKYVRFVGEKLYVNNTEYTGGSSHSAS